MDTDSAREQLNSERQRLEELRQNADLERLSDESETENLAELSSMDQHQADNGTETFEREKDLSILESVEAELGEIEHALKRLDAGTYGSCEACGKPIGDARLEAMPSARFCVEDQATAEREARTPLVAGSSDD